MTALTSNGADLFRVPFAARLETAERVLLAGAGGGFDVFAGLPLVLALHRAGKHVELANLSFTDLAGTTAPRLSENVWHVGPASEGNPRYFPEKYLAEWLDRNGFPFSVYCFDRVGVRPLREAYRFVAEAVHADTIVLIDGGTDILMRGDEAGLGTPAEDMTSLAAVHGLEIPNTLVSCPGFGIDTFHGVCHAHFLENVAALERAGGFLGAHSLHLSIPEVAMFRDAVEYVNSRMPERQSIVNGSIVSALEGRFGNFHRTARTQESELFINPLMAMYWHFDLGAVARQSLYLDILENTDTMFEVQARIEGFQKSVSLRRRTTLPV